MAPHFLVRSFANLLVDQHTAANNELVKARKTLPMPREHLAAAQKLPESGQNAAAMGANKH